MPDNLGNSLANLDKRLSSEVFNFHLSIQPKIPETYWRGSIMNETHRFMLVSMSLVVGVWVGAALIQKLR